jgi:hypothetical protein
MSYLSSNSCDLGVLVISVDGILIEMGLSWKIVAIGQKLVLAPYTIAPS